MTDNRGGLPPVKEALNTIMGQLEVLKKITDMLKQVTEVVQANTSAIRSLEYTNKVFRLEFAAEQEKLRKVVNKQSLDRIKRKREQITPPPGGFKHECMECGAGFNYRSCKNCGVAPHSPGCCEAYPIWLHKKEEYQYHH